MPAFHAFTNSDTKALVTYLRTLQGARQAAIVPGNSERGNALFTGKAGCSECHMAAGKGGFIASDLSSYAPTHTMEEIRNAIIHSATNADRQVRLVTATMRSGEKYTGRVRNEDNFSVQLQTLDGGFHLIVKADLEAMEYEAKPLMPSDYGDTLTAQEVDDIVSYVMSITNAAPPEGPKKKLSKREDEQE